MGNFVRRVNMLQLTLAPDGVAVERCCFCREKTRWRFAPKDVAVCMQCADVAMIKDVPSKADWLRREKIASQKERIFP